MHTSVTMPRLGESVGEGTITRWLKNVGDEVTAGEPLVEVSTDKVDTEIASPASGRLTKIIITEDETVEIGVEIAIISPESSDHKETNDGRPAAVAPQSVPSIPSSDFTARNPYLTRLVTNLAAERHVSLLAISGSGLGGRITKGDVLAAPRPPQVIQGADPTEARAPETHPLAASAADNRGTATIRIDITAIDDLVARHAATFAARERVPLTPLTLLVAVTIEALRIYPAISRNQLRTPLRPQLSRIAVQLVANTGDGQTITILDDASSLSLPGIARKIVAGAVLGRGPAVESTAPIFTVSDAGPQGPHIQTATLSPGQPASISFGSAQRCPTVVGSGSAEAIAIRTVIDVCLTYDGQIIQNHDAAGLLRAVKDRLEDADFAASFGQ